MWSNRHVAFGDEGPAVEQGSRIQHRLDVDRHDLGPGQAQPLDGSGEDVRSAVGQILELRR